MPKLLFTFKICTHIFRPWDTNHTKDRNTNMSDSTGMGNCVEKGGCMIMAMSLSMRGRVQRLFAFSGADILGWAWVKAWHVLH